MRLRSCIVMVRSAQARAAPSLRMPGLRVRRGPWTVLWPPCVVWESWLGPSDVPRPVSRKTVASYPFIPGSRKAQQRHRAAPDLMRAMPSCPSVKLQPHRLSAPLVAQLPSTACSGRAAVIDFDRVVPLRVRGNLSGNEWA